MRVRQVRALPKLHADNWRPTTIESIATSILRHVGDDVRRHLIVIDGVAGGGKTTLAAQLTAVLPDAGLVHVDDISWWLDWTAWDHAMLDGVVLPWLDGHDIDFRPPGWVTKGREGSVTVTSRRLLVVEGVGAGRRELSPHAAYSMFVTADPVTTLNRVVIRDIGTNGDTTDETFAFHAEAQEVLIPFLQDQRPWERADLIVDGESGVDGNLLVSERPQSNRAAGRQ